MYKIDITDTNKCTFCKEETTYHLIWECPIVQRFLEQLHSLCLSKDFELNSSDETFIFGESNKNEVSELFYIMLMLIKQYFYKARCQNTVPKLVMLITAKTGGTYMVFKNVVCSTDLPL